MLEKLSNKMFGIFSEEASACENTLVDNFSLVHISLFSGKIVVFRTNFCRYINNII